MTGQHRMPASIRRPPSDRFTRAPSALPAALNPILNSLQEFLR